MQDIQKTDGFSTLFSLAIVLFFLQIALNFVGSPLVKPMFAIISAVCLFNTILIPFKKSVWLLLMFSIFEGQGRVVWGYNPLFRIMFDLLSLIAVARVIVINKKIIERKYFSKLTISLISLHFIWWVLELFNPSGAGFLPSFITAKYYIFPLFLFFALMSEEIELDNIFSQRMILMIMLMMIGIFALCFVQQEMKNDLMGSISPHYLNLFAKFQEFTGNRFRPWGTSFTPGGMSIFSYLLIPLFFVLKPPMLASKPLTLLAVRGVSLVFVGLAFSSCFISQVRSAFLKLAAISLIIYLITFISSRFKLKQAMGAILILVAGLVYSPGLLQQEAFLGAVSRFDQLMDEGVGAQRSGVGEVFNHLVEKVEYPFGFGLGMTTGYSSAFEAKRDEVIMMGGARKADFWSLDNLYVFLFLEMGIGALFYIAFLLSILSRLLMATIRFIKLRDNRHIEVGVALSLFFILLLGDWGAVSIPFNPVSFSLWLWVSIGLRSINKGRDEEKIPENSSV